MNVVYAVKQNLRQASRLDAHTEARPWVDPYPDLDNPREHTSMPMSVAVKICIGIGILAGVALVVLWIIGFVSSL